MKAETPPELAKDVKKLAFLAYSSACKVFQDLKGNEPVYTHSGAPGLADQGQGRKKKH